MRATVSRVVNDADAMIFVVPCCLAAALPSSFVALTKGFVPATAAGVFVSSSHPDRALSISSQTCP